jgi:hypothetical protein
MIQHPDLHFSGDRLLFSMPVQNMKVVMAKTFPNGRCPRRTNAPGPYGFQGACPPPCGHVQLP